MSWLLAKNRFDLSYIKLLKHYKTTFPACFDHIFAWECENCSRLIVRLSLAFLSKKPLYRFNHSISFDGIALRDDTVSLIHSKPGDFGMRESTGKLCSWLSCLRFHLCKKSHHFDEFWLFTLHNLRCGYGWKVSFVLVEQVSEHDGFRLGFGKKCPRNSLLHFLNNGGRTMVTRAAYPRAASCNVQVWRLLFLVRLHTQGATPKDCLPIYPYPSGHNSVQPIGRLGALHIERPFTYHWFGMVWHPCGSPKQLKCILSSHGFGCPLTVHLRFVREQIKLPWLNCASCSFRSPLGSHTYPECVEKPHGTMH